MPRILQSKTRIALQVMLRHVRSSKFRHGYYVGPVDGMDTPRFKSAVRNWVVDHDDPALSDVRLRGSAFDILKRLHAKLRRQAGGNPLVDNGWFAGHVLFKKGNRSQAGQKTHEFLIPKLMTPPSQYKIGEMVFDAVVELVKWDDVLDRFQVYISLKQIDYFYDNVTLKPEKLSSNGFFYEAIAKTLAGSGWTLISTASKPPEQGHFLIQTSRPSGLREAVNKLYYSGVYQRLFIASNGNVLIPSRKDAEQVAGLIYAATCAGPEIIGSKAQVAKRVNDIAASIIGQSPNIGKGRIRQHCKNCEQLKKSIEQRVAAIKTLTNKYWEDKKRASELEQLRDALTYIAITSGIMPSEASAGLGAVFAWLNVPLNSEGFLDGRAEAGIGEIAGLGDAITETVIKSAKDAGKSMKYLLALRVAGRFFAISSALFTLYDLAQLFLNSLKEKREEPVIQRQTDISLGDKIWHIANSFVLHRELKEGIAFMRRRGFDLLAELNTENILLETEVVGLKLEVAAAQKQKCGEGYF